MQREGGQNEAGNQQHRNALARLRREASRDMHAMQCNAMICFLACNGVPPWPVPSRSPSAHSCTHLLAPCTLQKAALAVSWVLPSPKAFPLSSQPAAPQVSAKEGKWRWVQEEGGFCQEEQGAPPASPKEQAGELQPLPSTAILSELA